MGRRLLSFGIVALMIISLGVVLTISSENVEAQLAENSPWPMFRGNQQHTGLSPYDTSHVDGTEKWSFETGDGIESSPAIGPDGTIYIGSHDSKLYAINPDGTEKWHFIAGDPVYNETWNVWKGIISSPAIGANGTIYITSRANYLYVINLDGTENWRFPVDVTVDSWASPAIGSDGTIYIGSLKSPGVENENPPGLYAINPDGTENWHFFMEKNGVCATPAIGSDGTIYIGSWDYNLYAINPDGTEKWRFTTSEIALESSPTIGSDGTIYIGDKIGNLYAINPDGTEKWRFQIQTGGKEIWSTPAIGSDGTIYVGGEDNNLYAINPDGTEKWHFTTGGAVESSPAIGADGAIYVGSDDYNLYAINPDGTEKWHFTTPGSGMVSSPAIGADGTIYVGSWNHKLYAIGGASVDGGPGDGEGPDGDGGDGGGVTPPAEGIPVIYVVGAVAIMVVVGVVIALKKR